MSCSRSQGHVAGRGYGQLGRDTVVIFLSDSRDALLCCCDFRSSELFSSVFSCCIFLLVLHLAFLSGLLPTLLGQLHQKLCSKEEKI